MEFFSRVTRAAFGASIALLAVVCGYVGGASAQTVPTMTIKIYNDSNLYSIYPVLSTGGHFPQDTWLQAWFKITGDKEYKKKNYPYPTPNPFRIYINPTGVGIPPHGSVTLTLPLLTQLAPQVDPKLPDQYIDWWNGGRISIYESLFSTGAPPKALVTDYTKRPSQTLLTPVAGSSLPTCPNCQQPLKLFEDSGGDLPSNDPYQLTEYTLGAIDLTKNPYKLDTKNVDYDVSYVDNAYLPAAMEPYNYPIVGWVGTTQAVVTFKTALSNFLAAQTFKGWPQYVDNDGETILRIPSALHIMLDQAHLTPTPPWAPIEKMKELWRDCTAGGKAKICTNIRDVRDLFTANYNSYITNYKTTFKDECNQNEDPSPPTLDEKAMLAHVYGWGPFNDHCKADTNLLENTPGYKDNNSLKYQEVKDEFDELQYWSTGEFDPYVKLIHGKEYINTQYAYAYSVDDAVGNMQTTGEGLIIAVGGSEGLPNPDPATTPIHVPFGWAATDKVRFVQYGICTTKPNLDINPDYHSFDLSATQLDKCTISFVDNQNPPNYYYFKITKKPPYPPIPPANKPVPPINKTMIDCSGNTQAITNTWCVNNFGYTVKVIKQHQKEESYISVAAPAQPPK